MSDTVNLRRDRVEDIALRDLDAVTALVHDAAASHDTLDSGRPCDATARAPSTEEPEPVETETDSPDVTTPVERWQLRLSATQIGLGLLAFLGFLAMIYPQVISMRLAQWTAQKDFRAVCQALMSETRDVGEDCEKALNRPPTQPPMPRDVTVSALIFSNHTTHSRPSTNERIFTVSITTVMGLFESSVLVKVIASSFLLGLTYVLRWRKRTCARQLNFPGLSTDSHPVPSWVPDHIPRLQPTMVDNLTTGCNLQDELSLVKKRVRAQHIFQAEGVETDMLANNVDNVDHEGSWLSTSDIVSSIASEADRDEEYMSAWLPSATHADNEYEDTLDVSGEELETDYQATSHTTSTIRSIHDYEGLSIESQIMQQMPAQLGSRRLTPEYRVDYSALDLPETIYWTDRAAPRRGEKAKKEPLSRSPRIARRTTEFTRRVMNFT